MHKDKVNLNVLSVLAQAIEETFHNATIDIQYTKGSGYVVRVYEDTAVACAGVGSDLATAVVQVVKEFSDKFQATHIICEVNS